MKSIEKYRQLIERNFTPVGHNTGMNYGEVAGQTVLHFHVITRYKGYMADPSGNQALRCRYKALRKI
ncbi:hypothetical protein GCM10023188_27410 [Pontibacter saemangeumensis]|uniref:HIT domain-containing protein n=1 Tax=Pontibacter saemangeumensis TaxID=1084525 RepID=A0ABP8LV29_9BACT